MLFVQGIITSIIILYLLIFNVYTYFPYDYGFRGYFINCRYSCENDEIEYYRKIIKYKYISKLR